MILMPDPVPYHSCELESDSSIYDSVASDEESGDGNLTYANVPCKELTYANVPHEESNVDVPHDVDVPHEESTYVDVPHEESLLSSIFSILKSNDTLSNMPQIPDDYTEMNKPSKLLRARQPSVENDYKAPLSAHSSDQIFSDRFMQDQIRSMRVGGGGGGGGGGGRGGVRRVQSMMEQTKEWTGPVRILTEVKEDRQRKVSNVSDYIPMFPAQHDGTSMMEQTKERRGTGRASREVKEDKVSNVSDYLPMFPAEPARPCHTAQ